MNTAQILDAFAHLDFLEAQLALVPTLAPEDRDLAAATYEGGINDWLEKLDAEVTGKAAALAHVILRAKAEAGLAKTYEDAAADRRRRAAKVAARCAEMASRLLQEAQKQGLTKTARNSGLPYIEADGIKVSLAKTPPSLHIADGAQWPDEWLVPQPPKPDKRAALNALKAGEEREGFAMRAGTRLAIK